MKYLVLAVYQEDNEILTDSKEIDLGFKNVDDSVEENIENICKTGIDR